MSIKYNDEKKYWEASYSKRHPITREPSNLRRVALKSAAEAKRVEAELIVLLNQKLAAPATDKIIYSILLDRFEKSLYERDLGQQTIDNYISCLRLHTKAWCNKEVGEISSTDIRELIKIKLSDRAPSQQKNILKYIRGVFNFALEAGLLSRNPVPRLKIKLGDKIKAVLNTQQAKILLEKSLEYEHEWYPVWVTAIYTGMRNGELHNLSWDKVDFENNTILISSTWNKKDGVKDLTKSGQDRVVEIAPPLRSLFLQLKVQSEGSPFVLPRMRDWDCGRQAEILRMFLASIGLPRIRFHDLRASWTTMLLSRGVEPAKVMKLGGWKDLKTMMIYLRKAGIDTRGTLSNFTIHDGSPKIGEVLQFKNGTP